MSSSPPPDDQKPSSSTKKEIPTITEPGGSNKGSLQNDPESKEGDPPTNITLLGSDLLYKLTSWMLPSSSTKDRKPTDIVRPGMSMMNWMKIQDSRERPNTKRLIPLSEVAKHNKESDCWMVMGDSIYDITEFIPYHPGGVPEIMKGAGIDATTLFNETHRWVNFESILKSCFKGKVRSDKDVHMYIGTKCGCSTR